MNKNFPSHATSPELADLLTAEFGAGILQGSSITHEACFREIFAAFKPRCVLEIGTRFGLSSALFARLSEKVITVDIAKCPRKYKDTAQRVWKHCGVAENIRSYYAPGDHDREHDKHKKRFIRTQDFDFAFIDGYHSQKAVSFDFQCVKSCGCVLFHDYKPDTPDYRDCTNERMQDIVDFIDALHPRPYLIGEHCSKMALWLSPSHPLRADPAVRAFLGKLPRTPSSWWTANLHLWLKLGRARLDKVMRKLKPAA